MKQIYSKLALLAALSAAFLFMSCGVNDDSAEFYIKWESDNNGTIEIVNTSNKDIVLFHGDRPTSGGIMGGVRAGSTKNLDVSPYVSASDFSSGGWMIIRGITREEFNTHRLTDLGQAKVDFSAFATYKNDQKYRIRIDYDYVGDNAVKLTNRGRVGLELRKNSPEGEKVAYLPALQQSQMLYTQSTDAIVLFPYYVLYNNVTKTVTTLKATEMTESVMITPRPASNPQGIQTAYFPNDDSDSWEKIVGTLKSPVAYVTVYNGISNQGIYFTNSGSTHYYSQSGYNAVGSGEDLVFEVTAAEALYATDEDGKETTEIIGGGAARNLQMMVYGFPIPVLFKDETTQPVLHNGYEYRIEVSGSGSTAAGYKATITRGTKRDLSGQLQTP